MISLIIDTRDNRRAVARLDKDGKTFESVSKSQTHHPESILLLVEDVCSQAKIDIHDVDNIQVEEGPGSYTGLKVGASVANALGFSLQKKINNKNVGELVTPKYE
jgi:tRNA threonylcarbamoyladenosine biosynthesis protein TsaB